MINVKRFFSILAICLASAQGIASEFTEYGAECNTSSYKGSSEICAIEMELFKVMNDYRCKFGKDMKEPHLQVDTRLAYSHELALVAREYAKRAAETYTTPHQGYPRQRIQKLKEIFPFLATKIGSTFLLLNEIEAPARRARGGMTIEETIMHDFFRSPGHRKAMMGSHSLLGSKHTSTHAGAGAYDSGSGRVYAVVLFGDVKDHPGQPISCL